MRAATCLAVLTVGAAAAHAEDNFYGDLKTVDAVFAEIDRRWPDFTQEEYDRLMERASGALRNNAVAEPERQRKLRDRYERCKSVFDHVQQAFGQLDEGVQTLLSDDNGAGAEASGKFETAQRMLGWAVRDWKAGTPDACGDATKPLAHALAGRPATYTIDVWVEKAKQLDGLGEARKPGRPAPSLDGIVQAPRATVAAAAGKLPPKYVDNPQYGCGSLDAWQKTVTRDRPAGDPSLLPGCSKLDDESEGGATLQVLSRAKKLVARLDAVDHDGSDGDAEVRIMKEKLAELRQALADPAWKSPELDPMAMSFERLLAWETNQMKAMATRKDIHGQLVAFWSYYDPKSGTFKGHFYDLFAANADKCIKMVDDARADGVDAATTTTHTPDRKTITYAEARRICASAKAGMAAKKKADQEAAAAEDKKWKEQCGGDKYKLWKAHGEHALTRGGWDQSRPEQACPAEAWYAHHGPDDGGYYDCDKFIFSGNRQTGHEHQRTRWHMVCP